jgi:hypothetical protein
MTAEELAARNGTNSSLDNSTLGASYIGDECFGTNPRIQLGKEFKNPADGLGQVKEIGGLGRLAGWKAFIDHAQIESAADGLR